MFALIINTKKLFDHFIIAFKEFFSIKTLKKVCLHFISFIIYSLVALLLTILIVNFSQKMLYSDHFNTLESDMKLKDKRIFSFFSFKKLTPGNCLIYHKTKTCNYLKKNSSIVASIKKDLYQLQFDVNTVFTASVTNFSYKIHLYYKEKEKKETIEGIMLPYYDYSPKHYLSSIISKEHILQTKPILLDFRFKGKPLFVVLELNNIQPTAFIKNMNMNLDRKVNSIIKFLKDYEPLVFLFVFALVFYSFLFIYSIIFLTVFFFQCLDFCENVGNKIEEENKKKADNNGLFSGLFHLVFPHNKQIK